MSYNYYFKGSKNPLNFFRALHFDSKFYQENPYFFHPDGIITFCGSQGSGKTLSAIKCLKRFCAHYPRALVVSNIDIQGLDRDIIPFNDYSDLYNISNGIEGVIYFIDEIHVLWNSLESKNIDINEMATFCQMRKERRMIISTAQVYGRIAKPIREQLKLVILCKNYLKYIQVNTVVDPNDVPLKGAEQNTGELDGKVIQHSIFFHSPEDYKSYSTLNKIKRIERGVKK